MELPSGDWVWALAIAALLTGATVSVIVLAAVGSIRRSVNEGGARQSQKIRKLAETVATLNVQQQVAEGRVQALTEANRKLAEEVAALNERLRDADSAPRITGTARLLH
ncbi:hypothetical protein Sp245p_07120 [Azospirillum baldaniorum]|uniref:Uncharacterized protein n=1 Tax=Azospirillum baldaniorum TaxID=1064539 RepID=A0A9P1NM81_9PROT|nr:hypothetical protein [Azospirillum baldaniorum]AWJ89567.1 hypothetical protein Sp245p_07120 [Azospirillum baldaniorum]NUB10112.1 hypothetical protein [Azospirillum baldaniorum]TWA76654.1 hypothetical protein FBZ85_10867 [Azospirillum brasilense]CCC98343.1 exported protein of unknown function [Azospirillum baldaniorum]